MRKKLVIAALLILLGCDSRTAQADTAKDKGSEKTEEKTEIKTESETVRSTESNVRIDSESLNFLIEPMGSELAQFRFLFGGKLIEGQTSGKITFSNEKRAEISKQKVSAKTAVKTATKTTFKTHTTFKTVTKYKTVESKRSALPWYVLSFAAGLAFIPLLRLLISKIAIKFPKTH